MKIVIVGRPGSGKSRLKDALARELSLRPDSIMISGPEAFQRDIRNFQAGGHNVLLVYVKREPEAAGPDVINSVLFQPIDDRITAVTDAQAAEAILYPNMPQSAETLFGEDLFVQCGACLNGDALDMALSRVRNAAAAASLPPHRTSRRFPVREPIVLDAGDWGAVEWEMLCRVFGLRDELTTRIVLHADSVEASIVPDEP